MADAERASAHALRAIRLDGQSAIALATYGHIRSYLFSDFDTALSYLDRARRAAPNNALAWALSSRTCACIGRSREAIEFVERGLRLSPFDQHLFFFFSILGFAHYAAGDHEEAVRWCRRAMAENPRYVSNFRTLCAALVACGQIEAAGTVAAELRLLQSGLGTSTRPPRRNLFLSGEETALFADRLRQAGIDY
ncbi:MAG TPA: tetratricopeptide repeat protein [Paracoccaceae bacterium]|nr:tetratricopeptide repeat protein [Paracoccaceae bacterium]